MRKAAVFLALAIPSVCVFPREAQAWSEATHAYIADHIGKQSGLRNYNEMYGAMAPDMFNTKDFDLINEDFPLYQCIRVHTHGFIPTGAQDFMAVWQSAHWGLAKNAAYGYASHNDVWGADVAAHWDGYTNQVEDMGWVMEKAHVLMNTLEAWGVWAQLGIPLEPSPNPWVFPPAELLCQYLVMKAGDVVIRRHDPLIGAKVTLAALLRTPAFNELLEQAIPCEGPGYEHLVRDSELEFRQQTIALGLVMLQNEQQILATFSDQLAALAPSYLAAYNIFPTPEQLEAVDAVVTDGLQLALSLVEHDYMAEIGAIVAHIEADMAGHGVAY